MPHQWLPRDASDDSRNTCVAPAHGLKHREKVVACAVLSSCQNEGAQTGRPRQQNLYLTALEAASPRSRFWEAHSWLAGHHLLPVPPWRREICPPLLIKLCPVSSGPCSRIITSQKPYFQRQFHWELGLQHVDLGDKAQPTHRALGEGTLHDTSLTPNV